MCFGGVELCVFCGLWFVGFSFGVVLFGVCCLLLLCCVGWFGSLLVGCVVDWLFCDGLGWCYLAGLCSRWGWCNIDLWGCFWGVLF